MADMVLFNRDELMIEVEVKGRLDVSLFQECFSQIARMAKKENCFLVLSDYRQATVDLSILDVYDLPELLAEIMSASGLQIEHFKRALVAPEETDIFNFLETVCINRNQQIKVFYNAEEARQWLIQK